MIKKLQMCMEEIKSEIQLASSTAFGEVGTPAKQSAHQSSVFAAKQELSSSKVYTQKKLI